MLVRLKICDERAFRDSGARTIADELFVMLASADSDGSGCLLGSRRVGVAMFWRASMVAD
jgi:hypothetical protein